MATARHTPPPGGTFPGRSCSCCKAAARSAPTRSACYEALHEAGIEPDWVIGTSIGAINAALIAGNAKENRLARLRDFWARVEQGSAHDPLRSGPGCPTFRPT